MKFKVDVHDREFIEGFRAGVEEWRLQSELFIESVADRVVDVAQALAPVSHDPRDPPGRLRESIHRNRLIRERPGRAYIEVIAGGPGVREAIPMEFGTYKDRAQPYMRPALAQAAGAVRSAGASARLVYSDRSRLFARRARARARVQREQRRRRGALALSPAEARVVGRQISSSLRYRGNRRRR